MDFRGGVVNDDPELNDAEPLITKGREVTHHKNGRFSNFPLLNRIERKDLISICIVIVAVSLSITVALVDIFKDEPAARRALSLFLFCAIMWATEAIPLFITSLCIPILIVVMGVLVDPKTKEVLPAPAAANEVMGTLLSGTVLVALGAFTMSFALSKYNLSYRLAAFVLSKVGHQPKIVMLTIMLLELFLSMWINNVASPVVCLSLVKPMLDELPPNEIYIKALLLGIAYAGNIGGMTTPIASPQNLVAVHVIQSTVYNNTAGFEVTGDIGWSSFLLVSLPYSLLCVFGVWIFLWIYFRPKLTYVDPLPPRELEPLSWKHLYVIIISVVTITFWAIEHQIENTFGGNGIVGLIPVVAFFAVPILNKHDFKELSWDVLMLLAGGLALGVAIQSSGLLAIMANQLADAVQHSSLWVVLFTFAAFIWLFGNFISHTVAAMIVLPVIANVGCTLGNGNCGVGRYKMLVIGSVFMDSGAMGLPVTSFPNAQAFSIQDKNGDRYLSPLDYIKTGFILGLIELVLLMTVGFELLNLVLKN